MKTENKNIASKLIKVTLMKEEAPTYGLRYEFKKLFKVAAEQDYSPEDIDLFLELIKLEAAHELKKDEEYKRKLEEEEAAKETATNL